MKTVAVTGGIGSGKSAVTAFLSSRGIPVYDSDSRTKLLYDTDPALVPELEALFGVPLRGEDGRLDRKKLSSIIFSDPGALAALEAVVHPLVRSDFLSWRECRESPLVVIESAIILSKPLFSDLIDKVVLVDAPEEVRLQRAVSRDGADPEAVLARMRAQRFDLSRVDMIIRNDGSLEDLYRSVGHAFRYLFDEDLLYLQS